VDLADVVGRPADVVLDQVAPLEHRHLGEGRRTCTHISSADGTAVAFAALAPLQHLGIDLDPTGGRS